MIDGIYILCVLAGFAILWATIALASWHEKNENRKMERLVHRNLWRIR